MTDEQISEIASPFLEWTEQGYAVINNIGFARALLSASIADTVAKPTCPHCGLTDIEFSRVCHNSSCSGYAKEESFYRGWE